MATERVLIMCLFFTENREIEFGKMLIPYEQTIGIIVAPSSVSTPLTGINREIYVVKSNASITEHVIYK